jgi:hypothetical protein
VSFPDRPQLRADPTLQLVQHAQFVAADRIHRAAPDSELRSAISMQKQSCADSIGINRIFTEGRKLLLFANKAV